MENQIQSLGYVTWGAGIKAELRSFDDWWVTIHGVHDPEASLSLNRIYQGMYRGPSQGTPGFAILQDLATRVGGTMTSTAPESTPGAIY